MNSRFQFLSIFFGYQLHCYFRLLLCCVRLKADHSLVRLVLLLSIVVAVLLLVTFYIVQFTDPSFLGMTKHHSILASIIIITVGFITSQFVRTATSKSSALSC